MGRYDDVYSVKSAAQALPPIKDIKIRETDVYMTFNAADRLDLMSYRVYGDSQYWWVILFANGYQIEFDIEPGEILRVPYPLSDVLNDIRESINE